MKAQLSIGLAGANL